MLLTMLKDSELAQIAVACDLMLAAYDLLIDAEALRVEDEPTLVDLADAVVAEGDRRAQEDVDFYIAQGKVKKTIRPDGRVGYELTEGDEDQ